MQAITPKTIRVIAMSEVLSPSADDNPFRLEARLPSGRWAIVGFIVNRNKSIFHDIKQISAGGAGIVEGDEFCMNLLCPGAEAPDHARFFPGPVPMYFGAALQFVTPWVVQPDAVVKIEGTTRESDYILSTSDTAADVALVIVDQESLGNLRKLPTIRPRLANKALSFATAAASGNLSLVVSANNGLGTHLVEFRSQKLKIADDSNVATSTAYVALQPSGRSQERVPFQGMLNLAMLGLTVGTGDWGITPGALRMNIPNGEAVNIEYNEQGDGEASAKRWDFLFLGYEPQHNAVA